VIGICHGWPRPPVLHRSRAMTPPSSLFSMSVVSCWDEIGQP
jgi:hypothetical protein